MVVQELGWDSDTDDELRVAIEDALDSDMVDGDYGTSWTPSCSGGATRTATSWTGSSTR
jgi:hypothetical protein